MPLFLFTEPAVTLPLPGDNSSVKLYTIEGANELEAAKVFCRQKGYTDVEVLCAPLAEARLLRVTASFEAEIVPIDPMAPPA